MRPPGGLVLVTGATGFVGRHLVPALAASGYAIRAAVRREGPLPGAASVTVCGDIGSVRDWSSALENVDCVIHLAARAHRRARVQDREADLFVRTNVQGTQVLAEAARAAGVRHFIFMSSVAVSGASTTGRAPFSPEDLPAPRTLYGRTKREAEEALARTARLAPEMAVEVLRVPMIIGPSAPGNLPILAAALRAGVPLPLASIRNRRMFVTIDSLASFVRERLAVAGPGFRVFTVADPRPLSTPELTRLVAEGLDVEPRLFAFPCPLLRILLRLVGRADKADALIESLEVDITAARATGWRPSGDLADAVRGAVEKRAAASAFRVLRPARYRSRTIP